MKIISENLSHVKDDTYLVDVDGKKINITLNEEIRKNLIGLGVIDDTQESYESYAISGAVEFMKVMESHDKTKLKGWDDGKGF